jgi:hypothetical protein
MAGQKIFQLRGADCRQHLRSPQGVIGLGKLLANRDREGGGKEVAEEESAGAEELIWWSNGRRITPMVDGIEEVALMPCELD